MKKTALAARLNHACDCVSGAEALLTEIDSKFGDADHGLTMTKIAGAISQAWADYAADWYSTEETTLTTYDERQYSLTVPYYSVDSLGLVTFKRFAVQNGVPTTLMTLKMDSRTGQVYSFWLSTPADSAAAHDPESLPKEAALRAFADQAGLTSLGDWTRREDLTYPRAIYSLNGQALVAAASGAYTVNDYFTYSGAAH